MKKFLHVSRKNGKTKAQVEMELFRLNMKAIENHVEVLAKNLFFIDQLFHYAKSDAVTIKTPFKKIDLFKEKTLTNCGWYESDFPEDLKSNYLRKAQKELGLIK